MITDDYMEKATHIDRKEIFKIEQRLLDNDLKPETLCADVGFVNGESILESDGEGINLAGPSSGWSQSFEHFQKEDRPLDTADFKTHVYPVTDQP